MQLKKFIIITLFFFAVQAEAQQFPIFTQYWTNKFLINPAIAGHEGYTSFNFTGRKQWANLPNSPQTMAISGQTRMLRNSHISRGRKVRKKRKAMSRSGRVGYGGYIFNDNLGAMNKTGLQGTYAYHLTLRGSQLSFGLAAKTMQFSLDRSQMILNDIDDRFLNSSATSGYLIDFDFGAYYSDKALYAGFSTQNLAESIIKLNKIEGTELRMERQYTLMAGYRVDLIDFVYIEPSFNLKFAESVASQMDFNLTTYFKEDYWMGVSYRTGGSSKISTETLGGRGSWFNIYGGARVDKFYIGYSFDLTLSSIQKHTLGSHEVMMAVRIGDNARRYRWLNRY